MRWCGYRRSLLAMLYFGMQVTHNSTYPGSYRWLLIIWILLYCSCLAPHATYHVPVPFLLVFLLVLFGSMRPWLALKRTLYASEPPRCFFLSSIVAEYRENLTAAARNILDKSWNPNRSPISTVQSIICVRFFFFALKWSCSVVRMPAVRSTGSLSPYCFVFSLRNIPVECVSILLLSMNGTGNWDSMFLAESNSSWMFFFFACREYRFLILGNNVAIYMMDYSAVAK